MLKLLHWRDDYYFIGEYVRFQGWTGGAQNNQALLPWLETEGVEVVKYVAGIVLPVDICDKFLGERVSGAFLLKMDEATALRVYMKWNGYDEPPG